MTVTKEMIEAMKSALVKYSVLMPVDAALSDALSAALSSRSAEAGKPVVMVKPLEWEDQSDAVVTFHVTRNQIGMSYVVTVENLMTFAHSGSREVARFPSLAVAAAPQPNPSTVDASAVIERLTEALRSADEWMSCVEPHLQSGSPFKRDREAIRAALAAQGEKQP